MSEPKYTRKFGISPSMLNDFEGCPARFEGVRILKKTKFEETQQIKWGNEVHKALEDHVKIGTVLPSYLSHMVPVIEGFRNAGFVLYAEIPMAVRWDWSACGWWDKDCMTRGKVDLFCLNRTTLEAHVFDYKTGKRKEDKSQLNLYGTMALSALGLSEVKSWFMWIKSKEKDFETVNQTNVHIYRNQFASRFGNIDEAYRTGVFPTKPSPLCAYCPFLQTCDGGVMYRKRARFIRGNRQT
jgi:CRISPR/Cas system-associated exonuclease Cas4 (RecB family)